MYFAASLILLITVSLSSNTGDFVVIKPKTTFLSPVTFESDSKPPERSSSNSK